MILIVVGALGTVPKSLEKRLLKLDIGGRIETIQTTVLLKSSWILKRVLETGGDLLSLRIQRKTTSKNWCANLAKIRILFSVFMFYIYHLVLLCL